MLINIRGDIFKVDATAHCFQHRIYCSTRHCPAITINHKLDPQRVGCSFGSPVCVGWLKGLGGGAGSAHPGEISLAVWFAERTIEAERRAESFAFLEESWNWPVEAKPVTEWSAHDVKHIKCCSSFIGKAFQRKRVHVVGVARSTHSWIGVVGDEAAQDDFMTHFGHSVVADGAMFMGGSPSERRVGFEEMLKSRKAHYPEDMPMAFDEQMLASIVSPGALQRLESHLANSKEGGSNGAACLDLDYHE